MRRARKLLRACKEINNGPTSIFTDISRIANVIIVAICLINIISIAVLKRDAIISLSEHLSYTTIVMALLIIRNINLGFFEDKRGRTKNNLRRLIIHLPLSKKDFIYAQYMSSLQLFFPAFVLVILSMLFNIIEEVAIRHQFELGIMIIGVCMTYVLISLEKGILTYRYIDPRVREIGYLLLTALWIILNYISDAHPTNFIDEIINNGIGAIWFNSICSMGGRNGIYLIALALLVGHFCHMRLPMLIEKGKINDSVF